MNKVCIVEHLRTRYPEVYWPVKINLEARGIKVVPVRDTKNIWIKDYFPIQVNGEFIRFKYTRDPRYPHMDISNEPWTGIVAPIRESNIIIDGGNIVQGFGKFILTEKVIHQNGHEVVEKLEKLFESEVIIIPMEPGDTLGHSDGICRFLDRDTVLVNDYSLIEEKDPSFHGYQGQLEMALSVHGLKVKLFPNGYTEWDWHMTEAQSRKLFPEADEFNPGVGYYINMLQVDDLILLPAMKIPMDADAFKRAKELYPNSDVVMVDCSRLSMEGGLLSCISADYAIN